MVDWRRYTVEDQSQQKGDLNVWRLPAPNLIQSGTEDREQWRQRAWNGSAPQLVHMVWHDCAEVHCFRKQVGPSLGKTYSDFWLLASPKPKSCTAKGVQGSFAFHGFPVLQTECAIITICYCSLSFTPCAGAPGKVSLQCTYPPPKMCLWFLEA